MENHARQDLPASVLEFRLPDLGEGLTDAELVSWAVAVGDTVELNQPIADVETAKAVVSLPSPFAGRVIELLARPGDTVAVGAPLIRVQAAGADDTSETGRTSVLVGYGPEAEATSRRRPPVGSGVSRPDGGEGKVPGASRSDTLGDRAAEPQVSRSDTTADQAAEPKVSRSDTVGDQAAEPKVSRSGAAGGPTEHQPETGLGAARAAATPAARKLARELGLDLWFIAGSGPGGAVTVEDVRGAVPVSQPRPAEPATVPAEAVRPSAREERAPIGGIRKRTAAAMLTSARTIPQASTFVTADCTASMELLDHLRGTKSFAGLPLTPLALVAKATLIALADFPGMNVYWDETAQEIVTKHYVNLGIAVATERGLLVPNIKDAQTLNLRDLTREIGWLADTARAGDATPADLRGGTFTITNVGVFGVDAGVPLVNPGEAAILCLGSIGRRPWVVRDEIAIRWVTTLGVSFDHRMIDGELAARFLAAVGGFLEDPLTLLSRA
ncbi:dihydrolipoamide acetyltransferase family protein [Nocardia sp. CY41]|uniref:dihydrolipoamide acetyltransferase family protein n=1 Tax=Nocardia sp. CY41 TaxID=2608686 RepID=UPI00135B43B0|nr:dihydrolipoamide acetyltransferase family protein [Nocardia sp. CY41]